MMNEETPQWAKEIIERLGRIEVLLAPSKQTPAVLTREQAMDYVGICGTGTTKARLQAFYRWRHPRKVAGKARYSRDVLDLALARETGIVRVPASMLRARKAGTQ